MEDTFVCDQCGQEYPCDGELNYYTDTDDYILSLCFNCLSEIEESDQQYE